MWDFPRVWINEMKEQRKKKKREKDKAEEETREQKIFAQSEKE